MSRRRMPLSGEQGITVVELVVAIAAGLMVLMGSFAILNGTLRGAARTSQRVDANQRGRPVLTKIMDELHSVCVGPGVPPILPGSTDNSITFIHKAGSEVEPKPDKRVITLSGGTLSETVYPYLSGTSPNFTFSSTATTTRMLTNVGAGQVNGASVPLFRYYGYAPGGAGTTPLPTPLSAVDAAKTIQVNVAFAVSPSKTQVVEAGTAVTLTDTVLMRFTPSAEDATSSNLPCA
jgi:hypothetical protein